MTRIFDDHAREMFAQNYPETPHKLAHGLRDHPLLATAPGRNWREIALRLLE